MSDDGGNSAITNTAFALCDALSGIPLLFPATPEDGLFFYLLLLFCSLSITLYCLLCIQRQRRLLSKGEIRTMKQWLLPIYYKFLWFCVIIYGFKTIDVAIVYIGFIDQFQTGMPFPMALFHSATFWCSEYWLFDILLLFLASNSHGTITIRKSFWISTFIWLVSVVVITLGIQMPTNSGFLTFCGVYIAQGILGLCVMMFMCIRNYPHHSHVWPFVIVFVIETSMRFTSDYFRYLTYNAFCIMDAADYLSSILMPVLIIYTLKADSKHWSNLSVWMQAANRGSIYNTFSLHVLGHERQSMTAWSELLSQHTKLLKSEMLTPIVERRFIGGSGQVSKAKYRGKIVAVKEWRFEHFTKHVIALWCKEALISSNFRHRNIVRLVGICIEPPSIKIVMEWCRHGSLRKMLISRKKLTWDVRYSFLLDVASGMAHLHQNGLVHRDLKTLNLLVDEDSFGNMLIRICDFGSSRSVDISEYYKKENKKDINASLLSSNTQYTQETAIGPTITSMKSVSKNGMLDNKIKDNNNQTKSSQKSRNSIGKSIKNWLFSPTNYDRVTEYSIDNNDPNNQSFTRTYQFEESKLIEQHNHGISISEQILTQITSQMSTIVGSVQFLAPEILKNIEFKPNSRSAKSKCNSIYGFSADIYSFACVMWEIITRKEIYKGKSYNDIQKFVLNNQRPMIMASELHLCPDGNFLIRLMNQCWQSEPSLRPNFQQILLMLEDRRDKFGSKNIKHFTKKYKHKKNGSKLRSSNSSSKNIINNNIPISSHSKIINNENNMNGNKNNTNNDTLSDVE